MKRALALLSLFALPVLAAEPNLYGRYEWVSLPELDRTLQAKMDTGAYTSSLSAKDIELFQRDGEEWVRFRLATKEADGSVFEHKLARIGKIKNRADNRNGEDEDEDRLSERPVIDLQGLPGRSDEDHRGQPHRPQRLQLSVPDGHQGLAQIPRRGRSLRALRRRQAHLQVSVLRHRRRD